MGYIDLYKNRLQAHEDSSSEILNTSRVEFEDNLLDPLFAQTVLVKGVEKRISISSDTNYSKRRILFKENEINWGDLVEHEGEKWLVVDRPYFNKIHSKSKMALCTNEMSFEVEGEREIVGWDDFMRPIYSDEPTVTTLTFPCVVENITNLKTPTGDRINFPEGDLALLISYTESELIVENQEFRMFNKPYRISGIDKSSVHNDEGVLMLVAERVQN